MVVCGPQFEPAEVNLKRSFHFIMVTTFLFARKDNLLENFEKKKNSSQELGSLFQVKKLAEKTKKQRETESQKDKSLSYPPPPPRFSHLHFRQ